MTEAEKLATLKTLLNIGALDTNDEDLLTVYLSLSKQEILNWMYSAIGKIPEIVTDVPERYEPTQIMACVAGFGLNGAENQTAHSENGINRSFQYSDMIQYIRNNVIPFAGVVS